jgi:ribosomal protein S18 acetylase RimI-like enzyme
MVSGLSHFQVESRYRRRFTVTRVHRRRRRPSARQAVSMISKVSAADLPRFERAIRKFMGTDGGRVFAQTPGTLAFIASDDPEILGWCWGYHLVRPDASAMLYLHQLEVAVEHRRRGIGRQLLRAFMAAGLEAGAVKMFLTTGAANAAARSLYESMGGGLAEQGPTVNYWFRLDQ